jgi:ketosteroid isomerase-like protein
MKKFICLYLFFSILFLGVQAQTGESAKVAAAVETLRKAMIDGDKKQLQALAAEGLSYGHSSGKIEDKATFVETLASGKSDFITMDLSEQTISVAGNTAIVRHKLQGDTNDNGKPGSVKLGVMTVWQKQNGKWKLLARQAFKL